MHYIRSCTLLFMFFFVPFCLHAAEDSTKKEPVQHQLLEDAALRAKPSKSAKQVGTVQKDSAIAVHAISDKGWATVMHNGKKAYIESEFLKKVADSKETKLKDVLLVLLGLPVIMWPFLLPYMIYRNVAKRYKPVTIEQMQAGAALPETIKKRAELGITSDEEIDEKGAQLILEIYNTWTPVPDSDEKMLTDITQIRETGKVLKKVQGLCPTSPDMLTILNTLGDAINQAEKRFFNGSYTHLTINTIIIMLLAAVGFWLGEPIGSSKTSAVDIMLMPLALLILLSYPFSYWLSARVPEWKAEGKSFSFSGAFLTELAASSGDRTITTTRYSDGSSTKRTAHTGLQAFSVWFLIIAFVSWIILPYLIVINFWKNYVRA